MDIKERTGKIKEFTQEYWSKETMFKKSKYLYSDVYLREKCILNDGTIIYLPLENEKLEIKYK